MNRLLQPAASMQLNRLALDPKLFVYRAVNSRSRVVGRTTIAEPITIDLGTDYLKHWLDSRRG
jgi:hypothetical protein